jgi:hypothetical protein
MFMFMYHVNGLRLFSELWPPAGLLFIPQIYDCGKPQWNDTDGKTEELREKLVPVPLCPPLIPHELTWV